MSQVVLSYDDRCRHVHQSVDRWSIRKVSGCYREPNSKASAKFSRANDRWKQNVNDYYKWVLIWEKSLMSTDEKVMRVLHSLTFSDPESRENWWRTWKDRARWHSGRQTSRNWENLDQLRSHYETLWDFHEILNLLSSSCQKWFIILMLFRIGSTL